jgi:hypothetical protein
LASSANLFISLDTLGKLQFHFRNAESKKDYILSGLHAISTLMMILEGQDPCKFIVKRKMRNQLYQMLNQTPPCMKLFSARPRIELLSTDEEDEDENVPSIDM